VGGDGAVRGGIGDACEDESVGLLGIIKEGLIGLVDLSADHLSSAARAGSGAARVRKVKASLLREEKNATS
jgi:hypothetical protein